MSFGPLDGINPKQMVESMINTKNELELYIENLVKKKEDYMEQNVDLLRDKPLHSGREG